MTADPWAWWSDEAIAGAADCPLENVRAHWPRIFEQLGHCGIQTPNVAIGVIGTTAIEGASTFAPVREGCYLGEPEPAESHRRTLDYYPFYGRGHVQLTHANNYATYGPKVADLWGADPADPTFDLEGYPDNALDPDVAAAVISLYFRDTRALPTASYPEGYSLVEACEEQDWDWVRRLVYGGPDPAGTARIADIAAELGPPGGHEIVPEPDPLPTYDSTYPAVAQNDSWSCSCTSTRWGLLAWGRSTTEQWIEQSMLDPSQPGGPVVTTQYGLMDASGAGLAAWINREYGDASGLGYVGAHDPSITFDEVAAEAGSAKHPVFIGGRTWCHWVGVRGYDGLRLLLANPAPGYMGVTQTLTREQFAHLGPFSLVRLTHPAAESGGTTPEPVPPNPSDPFGPWRGTVGSGLLEMMAADNTTPAQRASTWLPLGAPAPSDIEACNGQNGVQYSWQLTTGQGFRYRPSG